jgi:hypothetical protein
VIDGGLVVVALHPGDEAGVVEREHVPVLGGTAGALGPRDVQYRTVAVQTCLAELRERVVAVERDAQRRHDLVARAAAVPQHVRREHPLHRRQVAGAQRSADDFQCRRVG